MVILFGGIVAFFAVSATVLFNGVHLVTEGSVGAYWQGGALLNVLTEPGYHWRMPYVTTFSNIQTTMQT